MQQGVKGTIVANIFRWSEDRPIIRVRATACFTSVMT